jgi:transposase
MSKVSRLEVIQTGSRRRWTLDEKRRIVAESDSGTRQVSATARQYGRSTGQLFTWRRLARKGLLGRDDEPVSFAEVVIADRGSAKAALPAAGACSMEIVLADGLRVIVEQGVDPGARCAPDRRARATMTIPVPSGARVWLTSHRR